MRKTDYIWKAMHGSYEESVTNYGNIRDQNSRKPKIRHFMLLKITQSSK